MELAFKCKCNDMDYSQINRMDLGKINFSASYFLLIAKALDVSPKKLLVEGIFRLRYRQFTFRLLIIKSRGVINNIKANCFRLGYSDSSFVD